MKILFIGDIVGKLGREIIKKKIPYYVEKYGIDFVIANGENVSHGKGLLKHHYFELLESGVDVVTLGNHYNSKSELAKYIDFQDRIIRPINLVHAYGGEGSCVYDVNGITIRVTNLLGTAFMQEVVNNPYYSLSDLLSNADEEQANIHIIDFHAEATAEKISLALAFDGKVSAVLCTHTHVQTKDARIFPKGTAFISDVGMCGAYNSVLGFNPESVIKKNFLAENCKYELDAEGDTLFSAVVLDIDDFSGKTKEIFSIYDIEEDK